MCDLYHICLERIILATVRGVCFVIAFQHNGADGGSVTCDHDGLSAYGDTEYGAGVIKVLGYQLLGSLILVVSVVGFPSCGVLGRNIIHCPENVINGKL